MCQDKLKLIDTHGFLWWNRKKRCFTFVGLQLTPCSLADAKTVRCAKEFRISRVRRGKVFFKTPGSGNNISFFYLEQFSGTQMLSIFTVPCIKCANDGCHDDASRWTTEAADLVRKINLFARCWCLQFKVEGRLVCFCIDRSLNASNDVKRSAQKLSITFNKFSRLSSVNIKIILLLMQKKLNTYLTTYFYKKKMVKIKHLSANFY